MANAFTDSGVVWANFLAGGYDKFVRYQLRSRPMFRQMVDVHPVDVTNPGPTVTISVAQEFSALATTPLTETVDPDAVAPPAPIRTTVTLNEYGNANLRTLKLASLAFVQVDPILANVLGKNMLDTVDKLVQNVCDTGTYILGANGGTIKSQASGFSEGAVAAGDKFSDNLANYATTLMRRRNAPGRNTTGGAEESYFAIIHPDVAVDVRSNTGWLSPHQYVDTSNIYNAEIGAYQGARYVTSPRCTVVADGSTSTPVYRTYFFGQEAIVEAMQIAPHFVIGPQTDKLRRFFPIGWHALGGWAILRQESLQQVRSSSSIAAL